jgi:hypothetical protein
MTSILILRLIRLVELVAFAQLKNGIDVEPLVQLGLGFQSQIESFVLEL